MVTLTLSRMSITTLEHDGLAPTSTRTVIAGLFLGTVSFMITGIQPVLLGGLAEEGRLSEATLGRVAWVEVSALALAAAIGPRLLRFGSARRTIAAACLALALANAVVYISHDTLALILSRVFAGQCVVSDGLRDSTSGGVLSFAGDGNASLWRGFRLRASMRAVVGGHRSGVLDWQ